MKIIILVVLWPWLLFGTTVGFIGDSVTYGHLVDPQDRFSEITKQILHNLGVEIEIINRGVNCQTTQGSLETLIDLVSHNKIDVAVIGSGINDASIKVPYHVIKENYDKMINILDALHIKIIIGIVEPRHILPDYEFIFDDLYRHIFKHYHPQFFKLLSTDILEHHVIDNVHPTTEGHQIIAERLAKTLLPMVQNGNQ